MHQSTQQVPAGISAYDDKEAVKQKALYPSNKTLYLSVIMPDFLQTILSDILVESILALTHPLHRITFSPYFTLAYTSTIQYSPLW